jgi:hypothetical protein
LALPYYWGVRSEITRIGQADYTSYQRTYYQGTSFRPWVLVAWTLRRNAEQAIENRMPEPL